MNFNTKFTHASFVFFNLKTVRILIIGAIGVFLTLTGSPALRCQDDPPAAVAPQPDQYFAGLVTALTADSVTLTRTVLGKATVRVFSIGSETVYQPAGGKLKLKAKVTVKWVGGENGDQAVKIILRGSAPAPKK